MKMQKPQKLATSETGKINGTGSVTKDKYPAVVANNEAILNAGAAAAFQKLTGMSINDYNAIYAPKGAKTKMVDGVVYAAAGFFEDTAAEVEAKRIARLPAVEVQKDYAPTIAPQTPSQLAAEAALGAPPVTPESINQAKMAKVGLKPTSVTMAEDAARTAKIAGASTNNFVPNPTAEAAFNASVAPKQPPLMPQAPPSVARGRLPAPTLKGAGVAVEVAKALTQAYDPQGSIDNYNQASQDGTNSLSRTLIDTGKAMPFPFNVGAAIADKTINAVKGSDFAATPAGKNIGNVVGGVDQAVGQAVNVPYYAKGIMAGRQGVGNALDYIGSDEVAPSIMPTAKPETQPQQSATATTEKPTVPVDTTAKTEVPPTVTPVVTPVNTTQPQVTGANAAKFTDTKQTAIPTELPITLAGMNTRAKGDDVDNAIKHKVNGKTIYSDSTATPQLPRPSVKPQTTQQQAEQPITINGRTVNPVTGAVTGDYQNEGVPADGIVQSQAGTTVAQTNEQRLASAEANSRDLSQRQTANDTPNAGAGKYATPAQIAAAGQTGAPQLMASVNGSSGQGESGNNYGGDGGVTSPARQAPSIATPAQLNTGVSIPTRTQQAAPQLGGQKYFQPREDGMVSLPRDVTQSAIGGSTPQERFAIQQQQLQQQPQFAPQLQRQVVTTTEQAEPPQLMQMKTVRGMADALANKYAGKQNDDAIAAYNATATAQQKALDSAQSGEQFNQSLAEKKRQSGQDYLQHVLDTNLSQGNANRSAAAATAMAAQAQRNWENENKDKNLVYTAGSSKLNPDTGAYETTPAQIFNKRTGEYRQISENTKAINADTITQKLAAGVAAGHSKEAVLAALQQDYPEYFQGAK